MLWPSLIWCMYKVARKSLKICRLLEVRQSSKKTHLQSRPSITSQKDSKHLDEQKKFYAQLLQDQSLPNTFCGFEDTWHLREIRSQKAFPSDRLRRGSRGKTDIRTRMSIRPNILSIKYTQRESRSIVPSKPPRIVVKETQHRLISRKSTALVIPYSNQQRI